MTGQELDPCSETKLFIGYWVVGDAAVKLVVGDAAVKLVVGFAICQRSLYYELVSRSTIVGPYMSFIYRA
jgi:hypothetical protein